MRRKQGNMARTLLVGALVCLALALASAAGAQDPRKDPPAQGILDQHRAAAADSRRWSISTTDRRVLRLQPEPTEEERTLVGPLKGKFTIEAGAQPAAAVDGLTFAWTNSKTISIVRAPPPPQKQAAPQAKTPRTAQGAGEAHDAGASRQTTIAGEVTTWRSRISILSETRAIVLTRS
jgi:hypothetical protein